MAEIFCCFKLSALKHITVNLGRDFERLIKFFKMLTGQIVGQVPKLFCILKLLQRMPSLHRYHLKSESEIELLVHVNETVAQNENEKDFSLSELTKL